MKSERETVLNLLKETKSQLNNKGLADVTLIYEHPKFGALSYRMKTREIKSEDFEDGTIALTFSINECRSTIKAGLKENLLDEIEELINNPEPILAGVTNKYRMLFDYP